MYSKNVRRQQRRIQINKISRPMPNVACIRQQIMYLERFFRAKMKRIEIKGNPPGVPVARIQIHNRQNHVLWIFAHFAVRNQLLVIDRMKGKPGIELQGRTGAPDAIDVGDQVPQAVRVIDLSLIHI